MKQRVNEFVDRFSAFHDLSPADQVARLVYFHTEIEGRETISRFELERLFTFASLPVPKNLPQLLANLCGIGKRLIEQDGEYKLRREVMQEIAAEMGAVMVREAGGLVTRPFEFSQKTFSDSKIETLIAELGRCYETGCWNACGILMRIVIERTVDSIDAAIKQKQGLKAKLTYCISSGVLSKSVTESLGHLQGAKVIGDIVAHHSNIVLEKPDIDIVVPHFRMLIKEVSTI